VGTLRCARNVVNLLLVAQASPVGLFPLVVRSSLITLLCVTVGASTFPVGAFPPLLPDLDRVVGLSNAELGALSGAYGFARMAVDVPVGVLVSRRPRWALRLAPFLLATGVLAIASGGPFVVLLAGRLVMGAAHALGMVAWLTTILRYQAGPRLGAGLNAFEFSAMLGMLGGVGVLGVLPARLPWNVALLVAAVPQIVGIAVASRVVRAIPDDPPALESRPAAPPRTRARPASRGASLVVLATVAGALVALTYAMMEQFLIPLRGSREFGLDRSGVARILMIAEVSDIALLLPVGRVADRIGPVRLLPGVLLLVASAALLVGFGGLPAVALGAVLFGLGMAGWMLPLAVLRYQTPPEGIARRTALYRVGIDGGLFLGPFMAGLAGPHLGVLIGLLAGGLVILAAAFVVRAP
jgi:predicted MFS family arabinose efflux permease